MITQTENNIADPSETEQQIEVKVWRGGQDGGYQTFAVPRRANQTVLDVVTWIQRYADPTLSYRFACRVGVCGSCAMTVNGRPRWTCRTHISNVVEGGRLEIGPLANLPVVKDLATDMSLFFEKWRDAKGQFKPTASRHDDVAHIQPNDEARINADEAIECINCGICFAACDTVKWNPDYLGPAALNRAWSLVNDERDGGQQTTAQSGRSRWRLPRLSHTPKLRGALSARAQSDGLDCGPQAADNEGLY